MSGQTIKLPDIQVPGTSVILTNVTVTVEPMLGCPQSLTTPIRSHRSCP